MHKLPVLLDQKLQSTKISKSVVKRLKVQSKLFRQGRISGLLEAAEAARVRQYYELCQFLRELADKE
jgi:hypothetical protein